jgi:hypothetical protein
VVRLGAYAVCASGRRAGCSPACRACGPQMVPNRTLPLLPCFPSSWPPISSRCWSHWWSKASRELLRVLGGDPLARAGEVLALVP